MKISPYSALQGRRKNFVRVEITPSDVFRLNSYIEKLNGVKRYKSYVNDFSQIRLCFSIISNIKLKRYIIFNKTVGPQNVYK